MLREEKIWDITPNVKIVKIEMAKNYQEGVEWKLEKGRREEEWQASKDGIGLSWAAKEKQIPAGFKTIKLDLVQQSLVKKMTQYGIISVLNTDIQREKRNWRLQKKEPIRSCQLRLTEPLINSLQNSLAATY